MNIDGVILAAGFSERAGQFKPELDLGGKPLLVRCIESMDKVCEQIIVVAGFNIDRIIKLVGNLPGLLVVKNENFALGMFSSVRCGIREVISERFFIIPGDQPVVKSKTFRQIADIEADIVVPRYNGKKGHPVLFKSQLIPEILALPDTAILRDFIHRKEAVIVDVDDPGIGMDLDTINDYEKIKTYYKEEMQ
ncbi:MAG: nucleotidyltransferase family protein [Candidatus Marinimicrobia bacterium]|nr:nucleotidyltransferase family protein [Candidatus Neomarinimicrobiota bacterium]